MKRVTELILSIIFLSLVTCTRSQDRTLHQSILQYPIGYPTDKSSALNQLSAYPLPRYLSGNHLQKLFNWINPQFLGSLSQPGVKRDEALRNDYLIQKELITNWNYGIVIAGANYAFNGQKGIPVEIQLANEHPEVSLDVITFCSQNPLKIWTYPNGKATVRNVKLDSSYFISYTRDGRKYKGVKFNYPDSLIYNYGNAQKEAIYNILSLLKRPINRINENGEEDPQAYLISYIQNDSEMIRMKDSMKIDSWDDFVSTRKLHMRNIYSSAFMKELPELHNTFFSFYTVEGGPIDRFKWSIMKKCMTPINGIYYSTPDFYPRWLSNWKDWQGAWHGWKWIEIGRKTEIKDGDYLFSPFVAAGWSNKNEENITPGQWLGLLKCLGVIGAEFYYVGYFNLKLPYNNPVDYVWQVAMPAYAQAITSRFEDVLKDGNVLFDDKNQPIISYHTGDKHVLVTARKQNNKEKYVICGTYQPFSNDSDEIPEKTNVTIPINGKTLSFEIRRQGSVYIYEKTTDNRIIFYQLDRWHENKHPERWSKDFYVEAEVADSGISSNDIYTIAPGDSDYSSFTSYVHLAKNKECLYHFGERDTVNENRFLWIRYKGNGILSATLTNENGSKAMQEKNLPGTPTWQWIKVVLPKTYIYNGNNALQLSAVKGEVDIDKLVITINGKSTPVY